LTSGFLKFDLDFLETAEEGAETSDRVSVSFFDGSSDACDLMICLTYISFFSSSFGG
jgi:hypothetical protein